MKSLIVTQSLWYVNIDIESAKITDITISLSIKISFIDSVIKIGNKNNPLWTGLLGILQLSWFDVSHNK